MNAMVFVLAGHSFTKPVKSRQTKCAKRPTHCDWKWVRTPHRQRARLPAQRARSGRIQEDHPAPTLVQLVQLAALYVRHNP